MQICLTCDNTTLVKTPWDGPRSLREMFPQTDVRLGMLYPDYKLQLVIPQEMDNESVSAINTFWGVNIPLNKEGRVTNMCKAWEDQRKEDLENGRRDAYMEMVKDGVISASDAAEKLGISEEEFERRMVEAGFDKVETIQK